MSRHLRSRFFLGFFWFFLSALMLPALEPLPTPPRAPAAAKALRLPPQQLAEKLLALGANVWIKKGTATEMTQVKSAAELAGQKFTFARVEFPGQRPDQSPLTPADYALLDSLPELPELLLSGETVTDAVLEKLRPFRFLTSLTLSGVKISHAEHALFPALPELRYLWLTETETGDDALKMIAQCRKLKTLHLDTQPITDNGLAAVGKMAALEELELVALDKIGSPGFAHFAECRALKSVYATGFTILSGMLENLAHCRSLETVSLPDTVLKDADIASLTGLTKLRSLDLSGSKVTGSAFASWPARLQVASLNLEKAAGVDDASCKNIEHAFPRLEEVRMQLAPSGFTAAGTGTLSRLHTLRVLHLNGPGVTDETIAPLTHCDGLTTLHIPAASLTEKGITVLAKLPHLAELRLDAPPLTDAAVKSFGRCKELKTLIVRKGMAAEVTGKLLKMAPGMVVSEAEE
jgi:hypothetical protein